MPNSSFPSKPVLIGVFAAIGAACVIAVIAVVVWSITRPTPLHVLKKQLAEVNQTIEGMENFKRVGWSFKSRPYRNDKSDLSDEDKRILSEPPSAASHPEFRVKTGVAHPKIKM